jgi:ribosomal protein L14
MKLAAVTGIIVVCVLVASASSISQGQVPDAVVVRGEVVMSVHAEGAQIYECKANNAARLVWQFREPIATLIVDGKTVGRHYAGPTWEMSDGSAIAGKEAGRAPGATVKDIPWLKLEVTSRRGTGQLTGVTAIQRTNTRGGTAEGACDTSGAFLSVPYSADYTFLRTSG